ncbi:cytochrome P450 4C1-like [Vespa velutina]|uniref:cytochrome P450 4C1-like n=1 Tax=Vespa velutina TaxID=202808 RepID=UPI001FB4F8F0|nr:cytochrome P450 4C1-like [Vespa velutina]
MFIYFLAITKVWICFIFKHFTQFSFIIFFFLGITQLFLNIGWNYDSLWRIWIGTKLLVIINNPEYIKKVLNNPNITEKSEEYKYMKSFAGNGLICSPAKIWNPHRKILNEVFHKKYLNFYVDVLVNHSVVLMEKLETLVGEEIDVCHYVFRCALDIIYDSLFDTQVNSLTDENCKLDETIHCLMDITVQRIFKIWLQPNIIFRNTAMGKKFQTCASYLNDIASNIIKEKKESMLRSIIKRELKEENSEQNPRILLDYLFESSHEGRKYSEQDIRDEINTMVIAGSDTSAVTISFVLLMLATFPHIQNEVYDELYQIYGSSDPKYVPITYDDIARMKLLERVIKETLRLFPPGPIVARKVTQDIEVTKNLTIPKGSTVGFLIYKTHRNEKYWPQPLVFDPDRFLPGRNSSACFFPFSYGKRNCIGQIFAMLEMKVIITTLIRKFIIKIDQPKAIEEISIKMDVTIKPAKPIRLKFERRN